MHDAESAMSQADEVLPEEHDPVRWEETARAESDEVERQRERARKAEAELTRLREGLRLIVGDEEPFADFQMFGKAEDRERAIIELARELLAEQRSVA